MKSPSTNRFQAVHPCYEPTPKPHPQFCRKESQSASSQSWGPVALHGTVPQSFNRLKVVNSGIEFWCSWGLPRCSGNTILGRKWQIPKLKVFVFEFWQVFDFCLDFRWQKVGAT